MKEIIAWILDNKEWIFSGIGIGVLGVIIKLILHFLKRRDRYVEPGQSQVTQGGSTAIQAGRDVNIGGLQPNMRRSVRLRVHRALFINDPVQHYFINVVNTSDTSEVEVTHVWYEGSGRVDIIQPQRCQANLEMSYSYQSRNVLFSGLRF